MGATGGPLIEMTYRGRTYKGAADSSPSIVSLGGDTVEHRANGDGTSRRIKNRKLWHITGLKVEIDHSNDDLQNLQDGVDSEDEGDMTFTWDGVTYQGTGDIEGEFPNDTGDATSEFEAMGPGNLKKIS